MEPFLNADLKTSYGINCSISPTKRRLNAPNLFGRRPAKKSLLPVKNQKTRVDFTKKHLLWNSKQLSKVFWSDESTFMIFGSNGIKLVRRLKRARFDPKYQLLSIKMEMSRFVDIFFLMALV